MTSSPPAHVVYRDADQAKMAAALVDGSYNGILNDEIDDAEQSHAQKFIKKRYIDRSSLESASNYSLVEKAPDISSSRA